jgi:capsular polysaccharide biosynthesis protein
VTTRLSPDGIRTLPTDRGTLRNDDLAKHGDPAPLGPVAAMLRHPLIVVAIVCACAGAGLALGLMRAPVYSAESQLGVGSIDVDSQALPGYVEATQSLAGSYSRAIDSDPVLAALSRSTGQPRATLGARLSASPVAESSVIRVEATATGAADAVRLANAGAGALVQYVRGLGTSRADSAAVLDDLRAASLHRERLERTRHRLAKRYDKKPTAAVQRRLQVAVAEANATDERVKALAARYQADQQRLPKSGFVNVLTSATAAASDRRSAIELRAFTGFVAGLLLAAALATALANRRRGVGGSA